MSVTKKTDAASGKKRWKPWQKNLIFALVVLAVAAALYLSLIHISEPTRRS